MFFKGYTPMFLGKYIDVFFSKIYTKYLEDNVKI